MGQLKNPQRPWYLRPSSLGRVMMATALGGLVLATVAADRRAAGPPLTYQIAPYTAFVYPDPVDGIDPRFVHSAPIGIDPRFVHAAPEGIDDRFVVPRAAPYYAPPVAPYLVYPPVPPR